MENESAASLASENDQQRNSDESQIGESLHLIVNAPIPPVQENQSNADSKVQSNVQGKEQKGNGKPGKELDFIEANYLKVNVDKIVERVYQYCVEIRMNGPKKLYTKVFLKFCTEYLPKEQSKQIAFDDDGMIALSPCELSIDKKIRGKEIRGKEIRGKFNFDLPDTENDWKKSKKTQNIRLNKTWHCEVVMRPAKKWFIPMKQGLTR